MLDFFSSALYLAILLDLLALVGLVALMMTLGACHGLSLIFFTVESQLSLESWTLLAMYLPFKVATSSLSLSASFMSLLFSFEMKLSHISIITFLQQTLLQVVKSEEMDASTLGIGIEQKVD